MKTKITGAIFLPISLLQGYIDFLEREAHLSEKAEWITIGTEHEPIGEGNGQYVSRIKHGCLPHLMSGVMMNLLLGPISMADRKEIIDIFNHYVETSFAAFPDHPLPYDAFEAILNKCRGYPSVTAKDEHGNVLGFGLLHAYNPFPVFSGTAELTYFIRPEWTGRGIGTLMLDYLCQKARERGLSTLLASVSSLNAQSMRFHRRKGFQQCGCFRKVGRKRSETFDIVYMQIFL